MTFLSKMSESDQLTSELSKLAIDIVMDKIFSYMSVKDLKRAAGVCRQWRNIIRNQLSFRHTIDCLLLPLWITPFNDGYCVLERDGFIESYNSIKRVEKNKKSDLPVANWHIGDVVRCVPKIFLVFCDANTETKYPFCIEYIKSLPASAIYVEVGFMRLTVDGTELYGDTNLGAGMSVPRTSHLQCEKLNIEKFFEYDCTDNYDEELAHILIDKILSKLTMSTTATDEYSCFILFINRNLINDWRFGYSDRKVEKYITEMLRKLTKKLKSETYALLGTGCVWVSHSLLRKPQYDVEFSFLMRIYGPALKSWSIVIDLKLSSAERKSKLLDFKKKVQVNSSTFALCSYPVNRESRRWGIIEDIHVGEFSDFVPTEIFKEVFPTVTLICFYDDEDYGQYSCNTCDIDGDPVRMYTKSLIYLLITTDS